MGNMPTVQTSYVGIPQEDVDALIEALAVLGIDEYTKFWKGCIEALLTQHAKGEIIAWPPSFALQVRDPEYIHLKLELAHRSLAEQEKLKQIKEESNNKRSRKK